MKLAQSSKLRIIVLGYIVRRPLGGGIFPTLQYALGLKQLGHEVWFFEDSEDFPCCYDPSRWVTDVDPTYGLRYAEDVLGKAGLGDRWTYYDAHTDQWLGPCASDALSICESADLVIAASGRLRPWTMQVPHRAYVDKDPLFAQVRHIQDAERRAVTAQYTSLFTYGMNIGEGGSQVPEDGFTWHGLSQPIVLDQWPATLPGSVEPGRFTTIMQWDAYDPVEFDGHTYGMKSASFGDYETLPSRIDAGLEMAVGGGVPKARLRELGWSIVDPLEVTKTPESYQDYIRGSLGEFTVAKHGYVLSRTGWFSERSMQYLASGRPVITQETGFSDWLPTGEGLLSFSDPDGAVGAIEDVLDRYDAHCRAARELAEEYFESGKVLRRMLALVDS